LLPKSFPDPEIVKQVLKRMLGNSESHPFADQFDKLYFLTSSKPFLNYISALQLNAASINKVNFSGGKLRIACSLNLFILTILRKNIIYQIGSSVVLISVFCRM